MGRHLSAISPGGDSVAYDGTRLSMSNPFSRALKTLRLYQESQTPAKNSNISLFVKVFFKLFGYTINLHSLF